MCSSFAASILHLLRLQNREEWRSFAYTSLKPVTAISEFELRSFVYDWYPRKVAGSIADARRVLVGLRKFFVFLEEHEGVLCPWAWPILGDVETFEIRWESFPGGFFWDADVQAWQAPHVRDLTDRILLPLSDSQGGIEWGRTMGLAEYALNREAHRLWIVSRDEAIRGGTTAPREVLAHAMARQREWAHAPNASCSGLTPQVAIARECCAGTRGDAAGAGSQLTQPVLDPCSKRRTSRHSCAGTRR